MKTSKGKLASVTLSYAAPKKRHTERVRHSSIESRWRTPDPMFDALDREFCFDLDAAARRVDTKCAEYLGPDYEDPGYRDALTVDWYARVGCLTMSRRERPIGQMLSVGAVFANPPYSRDGYAKSVKAGKPNRALLIGAWAEKCAREAAKGLVVVGVIPASTQATWWHRYIRSGPLRAVEIRTLPHRVSFDPPHGDKALAGVKANAGGNTAVVIWRPHGGYVGDWQPAERVWSWRTPEELAKLSRVDKDI